MKKILIPTTLVLILMVPIVLIATNASNYRWSTDPASWNVSDGFCYPGVDEDHDRDCAGERWCGEENTSCNENTDDWLCRDEWACDNSTIIKSGETVVCSIVHLVKDCGTDNYCYNNVSSWLPERPERCEIVCLKIIHSFGAQDKVCKPVTELGFLSQ